MSYLGALYKIKCEQPDKHFKSKDLCMECNKILGKSLEEVYTINKRTGRKQLSQRSKGTPDSHYDGALDIAVTTGLFKKYEDGLYG